MRTQKKIKLRNQRGSKTFRNMSRSYKLDRDDHYHIYSCLNVMTKTEF